MRLLLSTSADYVIMEVGVMSFLFILYHDTTGFVSKNLRYKCSKKVEKAPRPRGFVVWAWIGLGDFLLNFSR